MAMERNPCSVLAKLMGIDKVSPPHTTHERRKVLSENYLQNVASVVHRERLPLDLDDDFSMAVDGHPETQDTVEVSVGSQKENASLNITGVNSSLRNKLEEVRFLPQNQRFELFGGFDLRGSTNSCSRLGQLTVSGSSCASSDKTGCFRSNIFKDNDCYTPADRISERNKQGKKYNGIQSPMQGSMLPHEIAKQITSQVKNSVWHSCSDLSKSGSRCDNSSVNEHEEIMSSSSCLFEPEDKHEASPSLDVSVKSAKHETQNMKKRLCEKWRTRKCSQDRRTSHGRDIKGKLFGMPEIFETRFTSGNVNGSQVVAARYLSKPMLFPSSWVPRSRSRHFTLDKNWSLRPTEKNFGHKDLRSTSEPSHLITLDSQEEPSTPKDLQMLEEQNVCEEISSALGSFDGSVFSDVENPTSHEVQIMLNENGDKLSEEHIFQKENVAPLSLNCRFAPVNVYSDLVAGEEKERTVKSIKFKMEQLSAEPSTCILLEDRGSNLQDFCSKNQLKDNAVFEPGSPVSSLEGPEACMHHPHLTVESKEISSVHECFENGIHGSQKKLQSIETVSLESGSEGPGMIVSSDDGDVSCYHEDAQLIDIHSLSETRDFSYLIDVLIESGFLTMDLEMETEPYDVLTPSLFKSLEEKYGKQTFWEMCERRLLFDRVKCGLKEIAQPFVGINTWKKGVAKRYGGLMRGIEESIEEQLLSALVNQEEESKREASDKLCGREIEWLELDEDIGLLVHELESFFIDELVEDFVNLEITHGVFV